MRAIATMGCAALLALACGGESFSEGETSPSLGGSGSGATGGSSGGSVGGATGGAGSGSGGAGVGGSAGGQGGAGGSVAGSGGALTGGASGAGSGGLTGSGGTTQTGGAGGTGGGSGSSGTGGGDPEGEVLWVLEFIVSDDLTSSDFDAAEFTLRSTSSGVDCEWGTGEQITAPHAYSETLYTDQGELFCFFLSYNHEMRCEVAWPGSIGRSKGKATEDIEGRTITGLRRTIEGFEVVDDAHYNEDLGAWENAYSFSVRWELWGY